MANLVLDFGL
jgi:hypothetical protein